MNRLESTHLIGGCTGSTSCAAKIFRYQILYGALKGRIRRIHGSHAVFPLRCQGRPVDPEVVFAIIWYFPCFRLLPGELVDPAVADGARCHRVDL